MLNFIVGQESLSFKWFVEIFVKNSGSFSSKIEGRKIFISRKFNPLTFPEIIFFLRYLRVAPSPSLISEYAPDFILVFIKKKHEYA